MKKSRLDIPLGLLFIVVFYIFGAVVLLILLFTDPAQASRAIAEAHGLPTSTGNWLLALITALSLLIAYGLFSLSRWGYTLTLFYLAYFGSVNGWMLSRHVNAVHLGNLVWSLLVMIYLILIRRHFQLWWDGNR